MNELLNSSKMIATTTSTPYSASTIILSDVELTRFYNVTCSGELKRLWSVKHGTTLEDVSPELKEYLQSSEFVVGNKENNEVVYSNTTVLSNIYLTVMKQHIIYIEFDVTDDDDTSQDIATSISLLTGVDPDSVVVSIL